MVIASSQKTSEFCLELARFAKKYDTKISFDLNYRASFWTGREKELRDAFKEIASVSDILIGNEEEDNIVSNASFKRLLKVHRDFPSLAGRSNGIKTGSKPILSASTVVLVLIGCILLLKISRISLSIKKPSAPPFGKVTSEILFMIL